MTLSDSAKGVLKQGLARTPFEIRRRHPFVAADRATLAGAFRQLAERGVRPATVVDVGAAHGTPDLYAAFPSAEHLLIEPLAEFEPALREHARALRRASVVMAAAGSSDGEVTINVHPDLVGSSVYDEDEDGDVNGVPRVVRQATLDTVATETGCRGPFVLKIDTQGSELDVLQGAEHLVLPHTEAILLEASLFHFFTGGPDLADIVAFMRERGFVAYDIVDANYRPLDSALAQVDVMFVRDDGPLRQEHRFATTEQRDAQTAAITRELTQERSKTTS